jgi:hypothetical protein
MGFRLPFRSLFSHERRKPVLNGLRRVHLVILREAKPVIRVAKRLPFGSRKGQACPVILPRRTRLLA